MKKFVRLMCILLLVTVLFSAIVTVSAEGSLEALLDSVTVESFPGSDSELAHTLRQAYLENPAQFTAVASQYDSQKIYYICNLVCPDKAADPEAFSAVLEEAGEIACVSLPEGEKRFAYHLLMRLWMQQPPTADTDSFDYAQLFEAFRYSDGAYGTMILSVCGTHFESDPVRFLQELAKEEREDRLKLAMHVAIENLPEDSFLNALHSLESAALNSAEQEILWLMNEAVEKWPEIPDISELPKTSDGSANRLVFAVLTGLISTLTCTVLILSKKKNIA